MLVIIPSLKPLCEIQPQKNKAWEGINYYLSFVCVLKDEGKKN